MKRKVAIGLMAVGVIGITLGCVCLVKGGNNR